MRKFVLCVWKVGDAFLYFKPCLLTEIYIFLSVSEACLEDNLYTPINDYVEKQQVVSCN
jgi:hypothetical protein